MSDATATRPLVEFDPETFGWLGETVKAVQLDAITLAQATTTVTRTDVLTDWERNDKVAPLVAKVRRAIATLATALDAASTAADETEEGAKERLTAKATAHKDAALASLHGKRAFLSLTAKHASGLPAEILTNLSEFDRALGSIEAAHADVIVSGKVTRKGGTTAKSEAYRIAREKLHALAKSEGKAWDTYAGDRGQLSAAQFAMVGMTKPE